MDLYIPDPPGIFYADSGFGEIGPLVMVPYTGFIYL
jgi:hypothetical protein